MVERKAKKLIEMTSRRGKEGKDSYCWNEEVQESISRKKQTKKKWDSLRGEASKQKYKDMRNPIKEVAKAKEKAYDKLYKNNRGDKKKGH